MAKTQADYEAEGAEDFRKGLLPPQDLRPWQQRAKGKGWTDACKASTVPEPLDQHRVYARQEYMPAATAAHLGDLERQLTPNVTEETMQRLNACPRFKRLRRKIERIETKYANRYVRG